MSGYRVTSMKVVAVLAALVFLGVGLAVYRQVVRSLYPIHYGSAIERSARESAVDPFLLASMIRVESDFRPSARSSKGARGLMQILPSTGHWIAQKLRIEGFTEAYLDEPEANIRMGAWYVAELTREFGATIPAIAAFNAGRGNVRKWMDQGRWDGSARRLDDLPFRETRVYVRRVINARSWYHRVYSAGWPEGDSKRQVE